MNMLIKYLFLKIKITKIEVVKEKGKEHDKKNRIKNVFTK